MVIICPNCQAKYRIAPPSDQAKLARVKCPGCSHLFKVNLAPGEAPPPAVAADSVKDRKPLVLVVDDARFFREMIKDILKTLPIEIITAADGDEAWSLITEQVPQLVLLDLNIPGKSGREILRALQDSSLREKVRVVAMSAVERGEEAANEMRQIGATDFLSKSFTPSVLQKRVQALLEI